MSYPTHVCPNLRNARLYVDPTNSDELEGCHVTEPVERVGATPQPPSPPNPQLLPQNDSLAEVLKLTASAMWIQPIVMNLMVTMSQNLRRGWGRSGRPGQNDRAAESTH